MTEITLSISEELLKKMKKHPEIKWNSIAESAIEKYIQKLEIADNITSKSNLTLNDVEEIGNELTRRSWEKHKHYLDTLEK